MRKQRLQSAVRILLTLLAFSFASPSHAEDSYWAVGSAVPGGIQKLTTFPGKQYKYTGRLIQGGTLRFRNAEEVGSISVRYLKPSCEDAYAVTGPMSFTLVRDTATSLWTVPLTEDVYRITIDMNTKTLTGELFCPWNELFIVGGATQCGWVTYTFLPFTRLEDEVCAYEWTGELRERPEFGEPRRFKFVGQNAWEPKVLHPFTQDENIMDSRQLLTGGGIDNKWNVRQEGIYRIRVDVFRETVAAEYLGPAVTAPQADDADALESTPTNEEKSAAAIYDLQGRCLPSSAALRGIYIKDGKLHIK